jgi:hypothetical protein
LQIGAQGAGAAFDPALGDGIGGGLRGKAHAV